MVSEFALEESGSKWESWKDSMESRRKERGWEFLACSSRKMVNCDENRLPFFSTFMLLEINRNQRFLKSTCKNKVQWS